MPEEKKTSNIFENMSGNERGKGLYLVIVLIAFLVFGGGYWIYQGKHAVAYAVELESNPAIELQLNKNGRVIQANGVNEDGTLLLRDLNIKDQDGTDAVDILLAAMLKHGDLSEEKNSLLLTVQHENPTKQAEMQENLIQEIETTLRENSLKVAVLSPDFYDDAEVKSRADSLQISTGKMALIQQIIVQDNQLQAEDLAKLSINDLGLMIDSFDPKSSQIEIQGGSSEKAYIGHEKALQLAFTAAGVVQSNVQDFSIDFDAEHGRMLYEVEFIDGSIKYSYDLDAMNGSIISQKKGKEQASRVERQATISHSEALAIALEQVGLKEQQVQVWKNHLHEEDDSPVYEIEFVDDNFEYQYIIHGKQGDVVEDKRKQLQAVVKGGQNSKNSTSSNQTATDIGEEQAKKLALQHAGLVENEIQRLKIKQSYEHGYNVYKVEFYIGPVEYEFKIDAATGEILEFEQEAQ